MQYKLSICIPSYNRAKYLPELLDSIIDQVDENNPVEICISDNASEDNTTELIDKYKEKYPNIVYFRWPANMGADRNYLKVVEIASGEYCWLMGSDDKLLPGAIRKIISYLGGQLDIILCERIICDINMTPKRRDKIFDFDRNKEFNLNNDNDFILYAYHAQSIMAYFSYLSSIIFLRSKWLQICCDDRVIGSAYAHVYMLLMYCNNFPKNMLLYILQPLVLCRVGNDSFLSDDVSKRALLDLNGYELIAKLIFFNQPIKYRSVLWVLGKGMKQDVRFRSLLHKRFFSREETYSFFCASYKRLYGNSFFLSVKCWACDILYETPILKNIIKKVLFFIKYSVLRKSNKT